MTFLASFTYVCSNQTVKVQQQPWKLNGPSNVNFVCSFEHYLFPMLIFTACTELNGSQAKLQLQLRHSLLCTGVAN